MSADLDTLARTGRLSSPRLRAYLDTLPMGDLQGLLGSGVTREDVAEPGSTWRQGDPRPYLADEDPAVMGAIGRCAIARWRGSQEYGTLVRGAYHPAECGWCEYPAAELRRAQDWSTWHAGLIVSQWVTWTRDGDAYSRPTGAAGTYGNGRWRAFAAMSAAEQTYHVGRAVVASRAMLGPVDAKSPTPAPPEASGAVLGAAEAPHADWCDLRPDHPGDCPNPPDED